MKPDRTASRVEEFGERRIAQAREQGGEIDRWVRTWADEGRTHEAERNNEAAMASTGWHMAKIPAKYDSWKAALHQTCVRSVVTLKQIADRLGIHPKTLARACDENEHDNLSSKHLSALAQIDGIDLAFLDYLEALAGRVAYVVPVDTGAACTTRMTAQTMHATASLLDVKAEALEDGNISVDDARAIREAADNVTRCVQAIAAYAERVAQPDRTLKVGA